MNRYEEALADGQLLRQLAPDNKYGYTISGTAHMRLKEPQKALEDFSECLALFPNNDFALSKRGNLLLGFFGKYREALSDFTKAISINPKGDYYLGRSQCYYMIGDINHAKADAQVVLQKGLSLPDDYRRILNL